MNATKTHLAQPSAAHTDGQACGRLLELEPATAQLAGILDAEPLGLG